jgi:hypothetical protein
MAQFKSWLTCQVCGRVTPRNVAEGWLDARHRDQWDIRVVRCPQHWSEWALRNTRDGRTKVMRERMREALAMPAPAIPVYLEPFPTTEREEAEDGEQAASP